MPLIDHTSQGLSDRRGGGGDSYVSLLDADDSYVEVVDGR